MDAVEKIIKNLDTFYDVLTSLEKIGTITDLPLEVNKGVHPNKVMNNSDGFHIKVKDLTYSYSLTNKPALDSVSFEISPGSRICIAGFKNAGKETLVKLLLGTMNPTSGGISYNSISLGDYNKSALFNFIGNTTDEELFDGTILENLTMGKSKIQIQDITYVLQLLQINDYIISLPDGLSTHLTGGNIQSSKSMMYKIILGRALLKNPKLLIIDDNFFANKHEKSSIYNSIVNNYKQCTILFVSNNETVMKLCNDIILMKDGKIISAGKYNEIKESEAFLRLMN